MQKLLTIVIPTYNMQEYLHRCLDSLVLKDEQLMSQLEVLVVNDGSKDNSSAIAHEYETKYPNTFRVIDKENGNYGTCVNRGLAEAKGKYFRMLDADDWCNTEALNQLLEELKTGDADMVVTQSEDRREDNSLIIRLGAPDTIEKGRKYPVEEFDGLKLQFDTLYCSHLITYRTQLLRDIGLELQAGISYTDNEYVFFPLDRIHTIICYDLPVYQYLVGREGQTTDPIVAQKSVKQMVRVYDRLMKYYKENKEHQIEAVLSNQQIMLIELVRWIYRVCFGKNSNIEMQAIVDKVECDIADEPILYQLGGALRYGFDVLTYYRKTGRFATHPVTKLILIYHRVMRYIERKMKK